MFGLANKQTTNYELKRKHEPTTFANSLNSFYTRLNSYTTHNADSEKAADGNFVDGNVAICDAAEADGDDGTAAAGSDSELLDITVYEVRKQFGRCKEGKSSGSIFCKLFNMCLSSRGLPSTCIWKLPSIAPVPKSTSAKDNNNFRSIASNA